MRGGALLGGTVWGELGCVLGGAGGSGMRGAVGGELCACRIVWAKLCGGRALCVKSCVGVSCVGRLCRGSCVGGSGL